MRPLNPRPKRQKQQRKSVRQTPADGADHYRSFFVHALEGLFRSTPEGRFTEVNPALVRMLGYRSAEEVLALHIPDDLYVDPAQRERLRANYESTGVIQGVEVLWKKKNGEPLVVSLHASVLRDARGRLLGYEGLVLDITDRKRAEEALRWNEERYRSLAVATAQIVWAFGPQGQAVDDLPLWRAFTGQSVEEIKRGEWSNALHPEDRERVLESWAQAVTTRSTYTAVYRLRRHDGEYRYFGVRGVPVLDSNGQVREWIGTCSDITERKQVEEALKESEERLRTIITNAPVILWTTDREGLLTFIEGRGLRGLGFNPLGLTGQSVFALFQDSPQVVENYRRALAGEECEDVVEIAGRAFECRYTPLRDQQGQVTGLISVATDITERRRTEEELQRSQEVFHRFMDHSPVLASMKDEAGRYVYANEPFRRLFPKWCGKTDFDLWPGEIAQTLRENDAVVWAANAPREFYETVRGDDRVQWWWSFRFPLQGADGQWLLGGLSLDITGHKLLEERLRQSEERYRIVSEITSDYAYAFRVEPDGKFILEWITAAFSSISGFTPEELEARGGWSGLAAPEDMPTVREHWARFAIGQPDTSEFRILTKSGETRWLRNHGRPVWDEEQGRVVRLYGAGQDITERKRLEELVRERALRPKDLASNLRKFRRQLGLTQVAFGQAFGGYSQRQITSYETGEIEIPLGLLLAIRSNGYPLEVVLGAGQEYDALNEIISYLAASRKVHETARQLAENILRLLRTENTAVNSLMSRLGIPLKEENSGEGSSLLDLPRRVTVDDPLSLLQNPPRRGRPPRDA
ncbi:MAG TPA: PAS domain S-box protein [Candidatus Binatia bacterium]|nr:PAS domain S-box protein [Candidatus Binatia bacterium]